MNDVVKYGQTQSEKIAEEKLSCRQIMNEISNFGVSERQKLFLIYLLAMELENVEHMQELSAHVRDLSSDMFLIDQATT